MMLSFVVFLELYYINMGHRNVPMFAVYNEHIFSAGNITIIGTEEHSEMY